jgi:hypothetical protein
MFGKGKLKNARRCRRGGTSRILPSTAWIEQGSLHRKRADLHWRLLQTMKSAFG